MRFSSALYISVPLLLSSLFAFFVFHIPAPFLPGILFLMGLAVTVLLLEGIRLRFTSSQKFIEPSILRNNLRSVLLAHLFGLTILLFCVIDLCTHGIVLLNPDPNAYAVFTPLQAHIRHVSLMCWTLAPIALLVTPNRLLKSLFLITAFLFPILVLDRNRLLASCVATAMTYFLFPSLNQLSRSAWLKIGLLLLASLVLFGVLGNKRSHATGLHDLYAKTRSQQNSERVFKNTACTLPEQLPLAQHFNQIPNKLKWVLLYSTSPIFNFGTVQYCQYHDSHYLAAQIIPFYGKVSEFTPPPLVSPALNVGTEFLPFLLVGGLPGVAAAFLAAYAFLLLAVRLFYKYQDIFSFLLLLRISYCAMMLNFAPQMFTWTTFGFVILCLFCSELSYAKASH